MSRVVLITNWNAIATLAKIVQRVLIYDCIVIRFELLLERVFFLK